MPEVYTIEQSIQGAAIINEQIETTAEAIRAWKEQRRGLYRAFFKTIDAKAQFLYKTHDASVKDSLPALFNANMKGLFMNDEIPTSKYPPGTPWKGQGPGGDSKQG